MGGWNMVMLEIQTKTIASKDALVKVLATVFLNPADRDQQGKKIFVQSFLGCGCPDEVVEQAKINFFTQPLGALVERKIAQIGPCQTLTPFEQEVNHLLGLPKTLKWPRRRSGELISPASWRRPMLESVASGSNHLERLAFLRSMSNVTIDAVIEVPGRAFFFLVVQGTKKLQKDTLLVQFESGQMLYKLMGYNRCRLFTVTTQDEPKIISQIDTALSWRGLRSAFSQVRDRYAFADQVLDLFQ